MEKADIFDTVDKMVVCFGAEEAVKVMVDILRKMNQNDLAEQLENKVKQAQAEGNMKTSVSVGAPILWQIDEEIRATTLEEPAPPELPPGLTYVPKPPPPPDEPEILSDNIYRVQEILDSPERPTPVSCRLWTPRNDILDPALLKEFHHQLPDHPAPIGRGRPRHHPTITEKQTGKMTNLAEDYIMEIHQGDRSLEKYVEDFLSMLD
ncbi:hypothetical protein Q8A67_006289 [Cirrhinus molitorella]|uniref:Pyrin domain-containing protein n=1 Tax=Cirrhinus molitorella TaxID=172907 RepID=A0AA88QC99_9TELE|nr:hypothetical protein Q8A67_006289 [Cirrhinus molitorella]